MVNLWKKLKPVVSGLFVIAVIVGLILLFVPKEKRLPRQFYEENLTRELPSDGIHPGDLVVINYVISVPSEGERVVDTNDGAVAKEFGLKNFVDGPSRIIVGKSGKVKGFDDALLGIRVGDSKEIWIPPSEPVTRYALNKTREFARTQPILLRQSFPLRSFEKLFGRKPLLNSVVTTDLFPWPYKIFNVSDVAVAAEAIVKEGQEFVLPGFEWKSKVLSVRGVDFVVIHNPKDGQIVKTVLGPATMSTDEGKLWMTYTVSEGQLVNYSREIAGIKTTHVFKAINVTGQKIILERYDNPAEKTLRLKVSLLERVPAEDVVKKRA
ncbi:FKBP-type peptidyl-prolyl cis-trans isomerase [Candidatus Woesearchaeota archaeon]|nr:FKBP-type peptidyl-prolyl cis-trans isomerase [Candidatus Woesearchaeota archaeon]